MTNISEVDFVRLENEREAMRKEIARLKYINEVLANRLYLNKLPHNVEEQDAR